jgi:RNA polymerase sigma factor (sigma-70 family)
MSSHWKTRQSLIIRAKQADNDAVWSEFVDFYEPFIHIVLRQGKVPETSIDDTSQEILLKLWKYLKNFDPETHKVNFRTWLTKVIQHTAYDFFNKQTKYSKNLDSYEESKHLDFSGKTNSDLEALVQNEWESYITQMALANVKEIFSGLAVEVFQQSLIGKTTKEISQSYGITQASARTLRNRVRIRLKEEINFLRESQEF